MNVTSCYGYEGSSWRSFLTLWWPYCCCCLNVCWSGSRGSNEWRNTEKPHDYSLKAPFSSHSPLCCLVFGDSVGRILYHFDGRRRISSGPDLTWWLRTDQGRCMMMLQLPLNKRNAWLGQRKTGNDVSTWFPSHNEQRLTDNLLRTLFHFLGTSHHDYHQH